MSNAKVVMLINEAEKREAAKADAIAQDLYAALEPLRDSISLLRQGFNGLGHDLAAQRLRIEALERDVEQLKATNGLLKNLRTT